MEPFTAYIIATVIGIAYQAYAGSKAESAARKADQERRYDLMEERTRQREMDRMMADQRMMELDMSRAQMEESRADREYSKRRQAEADAVRQRVLRYIDEPPADRQAAYGEIQKTLAEKMHAEADPKYNEMVRAKEEALATRGMTGSRAYVDTLAELDKQKGEMDTGIARDAVLAGEEAAKGDRAYWLDLVGMLDSGASRETVNALESRRLAESPMSRASSLSSNMFGTDTYSRLKGWESELDKARARNQQGWGNTINGLAALYGYSSGKGGGGNSYSPGKSSSLYYKAPGGYNYTYSYSK